NHKQICAAQSAEIVAPCLVAGSEIGKATPIKIAYVIDGHLLTVDDCIWKHRDVRVPVTVLSWRNAKPPSEDAEEYKSDDQPGPATMGKPEPCDEDSDEPKRGSHLANDRRRGKIEIERTSRQGSGHSNDKRRQQTAKKRDH